MKKFDVIARSKPVLWLLRLVTVLALLTGLFTAIPPQVARAANIQINVDSILDVINSTDGVCTLPEAIMVSNGDLTDADCYSGTPSAGDTFTILLQAGETYSLTTAHEMMPFDGPVGLPAINADITIKTALAGGEATIRRSDSADPFRIFFVVSGKLTLDGIHVANGALPGVANNDGYGGGCIYNAAELVLQNSSVSGCRAGDLLNTFGEPQGGRGGGIFSGGFLTITHSSITGNIAGSGLACQPDRPCDGGNGGGIYSEDTTAAITFSTISGNTAGDCNDGGVNGNGGGIQFEGGDLTITDSLIADNSTGQGSTPDLAKGGGLFFYSYGSGSLEMTNSTVSGNMASGTNPGTLQSFWGQGGGVFLVVLSEEISATFNYVTFRDNVIENVYAVVSSSTFTTGKLNLTLFASIFSQSWGSGNFVIETDAGGGAEPIVVLDRSYTILNDSSLVDTGIGNLNDTDPEVDDLADNGGSTQTHALTYTSPAIDIVPTPACVVTTDQRTVSRPANDTWNETSGCDAGAYEFGTRVCGPTEETEIYLPTQGSPSIYIEAKGTGDIFCFVAELFNQPHPNGTGIPGGYGINEDHYWHLAAFTEAWIPASGYNLRLTLPHTLSATDSDAFVCKWLDGLGPGAGWDCARTSSNPFNVTRAGITDLSDWAVGNRVTPSAVTLNSLVAHTASVPLAAMALGGLALLGCALWLARKRA